MSNEQPKLIWVEPVAEPVPYPAKGAGPLRFITEPVELPESIRSDPYWQERLVSELRICKAPARAKPKAQPPAAKKEKAAEGAEK